MHLPIGCAFVLSVSLAACSPKSVPLATPPASTGQGTLSSRGSGPAGAVVRDWTGLLNTSVMAIGAETTGMTLTSETDVVELRATGAVLEALLKLDGQRVTVRGTLTEQAGVEVRRRRIVDVTAIVPR